MSRTLLLNKELDRLTSHYTSAPIVPPPSPIGNRSPSTSADVGLTHRADSDDPSDLMREPSMPPKSSPFRALAARTMPLLASAGAWRATTHSCRNSELKDNALGPLPITSTSRSPLPLSVLNADELAAKQAAIDCWKARGQRCVHLLTALT